MCSCETRRLDLEIGCWEGDVLLVGKVADELDLHGMPRIESGLGTTKSCFTSGAALTLTVTVARVTGGLLGRAKRLGVEECDPFAVCSLQQSGIRKDQDRGGP